MAVPLYDTASVILIRIREGRSPFVGDRCHLSHRLVERGLTPPNAVRTIDLITLCGGLGSLLLHRPGHCSWPWVVGPDSLPARPGGDPGGLLGASGVNQIMSRRTPRTTAAPVSKARTAPKREARDVEDDEDVDSLLRLGEGLRRIALGATASLLTVRALWPSEPDYREDAGGGLIWVFALMLTFGVAIASALMGGTVRFRWSWADLGVTHLAAHRDERAAGGRCPGCGESVVGVGRIRDGVFARAQPPENARGIDSACGCARRDGRGARGLRAVSGHRRAAALPRVVQQSHRRGAADPSDRAGEPSAEAL